MRPALIALASAMLLAAAPAPEAPAPAWDEAVSQSEAGNPLLGNQAAPVRLVEFISYTCPHCASYALEAEAPLRTGLVREGRIAVEVRPFYRNQIDVAATLLALCGAQQAFFANHQAILAAQGKWLQPPLNPNAQQRWANPAFGPRMKAVAEDLGLYRVMLERGYAPVELDRCLADEALALRHAESTQQAIDKLGVQGTPSFLVNGKLQHAHGWAELRPLLEAATAVSR